MDLNVKCYECLIRRQVHLAEQQPDDSRRISYVRDCLQIILDAPKDATSPYMVSRFNRAFAKYYPVVDRYSEQKKFSNEFVMKRLTQIKEVLERADEPVKMALKFARLGNYIDFGALGDSVNEKDFNSLIDKAENDTIDDIEYQNFIRELETAKKLLYITDNAGEVVLDKLFIEALQYRFPRLSICVAVRGQAVLNDATREDAREIGLDQIVRVIDNGSDIAGTHIPEIGEEMRRELDTSEVILAKGQGNFETMLGCGRNVYYAFLCKCELFVEMFQVPQLTGMFLNELRIQK